MSSIVILNISGKEIHFFVKNVKRLNFPLKLDVNRINIINAFYLGNQFISKF